MPSLAKGRCPEGADEVSFIRIIRHETPKINNRPLLSLGTGAYGINESGQLFGIIDERIYLS